MRSKELGFDREQTLIIKSMEQPKPPGADSLFTKGIKSFRNKLDSYMAINGLTVCSSIPGRENENYIRGRVARLGDDTRNAHSYYWNRIDEHYIGTLGLSLIAGRNFKPNETAERNTVIVNRGAAQLLGFENPQQAIGENIYCFGEREIIGVLENIHTKSLKSDFEPTVFVGDFGAYQFFAVNIGTSNYTQVLADIKTQWVSTFPDKPFDYFFLDDYFGLQYLAEEQLSKALRLFASLAIFVACLGLLGLAMAVTKQKVKEIGIRKVLGASVNQIFRLLSKDLVRLIFLASLIAIPIAYLVIKWWLENYAFQMELTWRLFVFPAMLVVLTALVTIAFETVKSALANPVDALKYE